MLYIKFQILNTAKLREFQKLFDYLVAVRVPGFEFESNIDNVDWDTISSEEMDLLFNEELQQEKRFEKLLPMYVVEFLENYLKYENEKLGNLGILSITSIFDYLEVGFEVDMNGLENLNNDLGIIKFSTGNYPFGGMERFFMVLKAFNLIPYEIFNGFGVVEIVWQSDFEYNSLEMPDKTAEYLKK